jgi:hypothetical protein
MRNIFIHESSSEKNTTKYIDLNEIAFLKLKSAKYQSQSDESITVILILKSGHEEQLYFGSDVEQANLFIERFKM